jgi:predicted TIM-barrel fold metal-dependent hydrolase
VLRRITLVGGWFKSTLDYDAGFLNYFDSDQETLLDALNSTVALSPNRWVFCILPMDMNDSVDGKHGESYENQIQKLIKLAQGHPRNLIPFFAANSRNPDMMRLFKQYISDGSTTAACWGVKFYGALSGYPSDPKNMPMWAECEARNIPVTSHTSAGGVHTTDKTLRKLEWIDESGALHSETRVFKNASDYGYLSHPSRWVPVLKQYPNLRLNLAHFWSLEGDGIKLICDLMRTYPNVYTDISYTLSDVSKFDILKGLCDDPTVYTRVLWGLDFFMSELENSESTIFNIAVSRIGADLMRQISIINPRKFLF